jgi:hypothetical protein
MPEKNSFLFHGTRQGSCLGIEPHLGETCVRPGNTAGTWQAVQRFGDERRAPVAYSGVGEWFKHAANTESQTINHQEGRGSKLAEDPAGVREGGWHQRPSEAHPDHRRGPRRIQVSSPFPRGPSTCPASHAPSPFLDPKGAHLGLQHKHEARVAAARHDLMRNMPLTGHSSAQEHTHPHAQGQAGPHGVRHRSRCCHVQAAQMSTHCDDGRGVRLLSWGPRLRL